MGRIVELSPEPFYAKLHMATALPDNSIQPVPDSQMNDICNAVVEWCADKRDIKVNYNGLNG